MIDHRAQSAVLNGQEVVERSPLVSVGLPTYNRASSLRRAIESVLAQDYTNLELVISDNASTDDTESCCEEYAARDKRVEYYRQAENRGVYVNFATVLQRSTGKYFMWLGDDDWLEPSYLSRCVDVLTARPHVSLVCGTARYFDGEKVAFEGVRVNLTSDAPAERVLAFYEQVNDNGTFYGVALRETFLANPPPTVLGGDWLMIASLAQLGKIVTLDDVAVNRSSRGASADVRLLAKDHGMSARKARQPHRAIAVNVARDIALDSQAFRTLGAVPRWVLAGRCAMVVHRRFVSEENPVKTLARRIRNKANRLLRRG
jgi:glycosyltransferase involved in cell wall biosynthesis